MGGHHNEIFENRDFHLARGGPKRFDSVKSGLELLEEDCTVAIHDAVRPMVSIETIRRCFDSARDFGSAIPVIDVEDTIRSVEKETSFQLQRQSLRQVQTPQVFDAKQLKEAYTQQYRPEFTDDASVYEMRYGSVKLVEGNKENIKITTPSDLKIASTLLG